MLTRRLVILGAMLAVAGCTLENQDAPALIGPSELGLSLDITATPDIISQNGQAEATIAVLARDGINQPVKNLELRLETFVGDLPTDFGVLSTKATQTGADGRATLTYRAPAAPPPSVQNDTVVRVGVRPVGSNYSGSTQRFVEIRLTRPGVITPPDSDVKPAIAFGPAAPKVGDMVSFDASASTASGRSITSYQWSFGDGGNGTGKILTHEYSHPGAYVVTLTITDDMGRRGTKTQTIAVGANLPKADFVFSPTNPVPNEKVFFNAKTATAAVGRRIVRYEWDFDDYVELREVAEVDHTFLAERTYTVVLTVTDDLGQKHTVSKTITVGAAEAEAP